MSAVGVLETVALEAVAIFGTTPRNIGGITLDVTVEETGVDEMQITEHPVESSAAISDHAFKKPATVTIKACSTNSSLNALGGTISSLLAGNFSGLSTSYVIDVYNNLLALQASAKLFTVVTGKRSYSNMLMKSLTQTTDKRFENALSVTCVFQELIIIQTSVTAVTAPSQAALANPASNSSTQNNGTQSLQPAPNYNAAAAADFDEGGGS